MLYLNELNNQFKEFIQNKEIEYTLISPIPTEKLKSLSFDRVTMNRMIDGEANSPFSYSVFEFTYSLRDIKQTLVTSYHLDTADEPPDSPYSAGGYFFNEDSDSLSLVFGDYSDPIEALAVDKETAEFIFYVFEDFNLRGRLYEYYTEACTILGQAIIDKYFANHPNVKLHDTDSYMYICFGHDGDTLALPITQNMGFDFQK